MKTTYLLPHSYQRIGLLALYSALALLFLYFLTCMAIAFSSYADSLLNPESYFVNLVYYIDIFLICTGLTLVAFSKEKQEDEMIVSIRKDSVVTAAYAIFLLYMALTIITQFIGFQNLTFGFQEDNALGGIATTIVQPIIIFAIYEIIFRIKLAKLKKSLIDEE